MRHFASQDSEDLRFQSHHRLTRFALLNPKLESKGNHQIDQSTQDSLFSGLDDIGVNLGCQLGLATRACKLTGLSGGEMILII